MYIMYILSFIIIIIIIILMLFRLYVLHIPIYLICYIGKHVGPRGTFLARLLIASDTICHDMRSVLLVKITVVSYRKFIYNTGREFIMYFIDTYKEFRNGCMYVITHCNMFTTNTTTTGSGPPDATTGNTTNNNNTMRASSTASLTVSEKLLVTESNRLYRKNLLRSYIQPMKIGEDSVVCVYLYYS